MTPLLHRGLHLSRVLAGLIAALTAAQSILTPIAEASVWAERRPVSVRFPNLPPSLPSSGVVESSSNSPFSAIPSSFGSLQTVASPSNPRGEVLLVQDIHLHHEAQTQISKLIRSIGPRVSFVGLEAAFSPVSLDAYRRFSHPESVGFAADYLLEKNRISGPIHAALTSASPIDLVGIDDPELYGANAAAVREANGVHDAAAAAWRRAEAPLAAEKRAAFNPDLLSFDADVVLYREGRRSLAEHVDALARRLGRLTPACEVFLRAVRLESGLDLERVAEERRRFAGELANRLAVSDADRLAREAIAHRLGRATPLQFHRLLSDLAARSGVPVARFPALEAYLRYLELADQVKPEAVLADVERTESNGYALLAKRPTERALIEKSELHYLTGRLLAHGLRPAEWSRYRSLAKARRAGRPEGIESFEKFYAAAHERDDAMANRFLGEIRRSPTGHAMMVVGGYHVPGLTRRLSDAGYRVLTFTPAVTNLDGGANYLSAFLSERTPLERLFRAPRLTLAPAPVPAAVAHAELPALVAAGETLAGRLDGDASQVIRSVSAASGLAATSKRRGSTAEMLLTLGRRAWRLDVKGDKSGRIRETALSPADTAELTPSLLANLFGGRPGHRSRWSWLNWPIRIIFFAAIIPHELGHLIVGPRSGNRLDFGLRRLLVGLFYGMPWRTRGPPVLAGIAINYAILFMLLGLIGLLGPEYMEAHSSLHATLMFLVFTNLIFVASEIILTPFARRLGLSVSPDLYFLENGEVLHMLRPAGEARPRKHLRMPDLGLVPPGLRADAIEAFEELGKRRPIPGRIEIVETIPETAGVLHHADEFAAWSTDGRIFIRADLFTYLTAQSGEPQFPVPSRETPTFRGLIVTVLHAAFQYHKLNQHPTAAHPSDFDHWGHEADERFNLSSTVSSYELLDQYEQQFESPKTMAVEKIRWAAQVLGFSRVDTTQLVEPDWTYRFEIPVEMDNGSEPTVVVAWRTQHNDALGQNKGGLRYVPGLDDPTVGDLSREMSIKVAVVNLPLGGGKGGARLDPKTFTPNELARFTRGFVRELHRLSAIGPEIDVPAPDMNTGAETMAWIADEYLRLEVAAGRILHPEMTALAASTTSGPTETPLLDRYVALWEAGVVDGTPLAVVTGKPVEVVVNEQTIRRGGIIGREEATARGGYYVAQEAVKHYLGRKDLKGLRVSIQGFGNVGYWMAKILYDAGAKIVSISEIKGAVHRAEGIDIDALKAHFDAQKTFAGYAQDGAAVNVGETVGDQPLYAAADILIPAAREKQIRTDNVDQIHPDVKLIIELANGPTTPGAEDRLKLQRPGLVVIPDVLANAGGVTVSHFEWQRNMGQLPKDISLESVRQLLKDVMVPAARELFAVADSKGITPRESTYVVAVRRLRQKAHNGASTALIAWLRRNVGSGLTSFTSVFGLMPWLTGPAYSAAVRSSPPGRRGLPLAAAALGGFVEEAAVRPLGQLAVAFLLPAAVPLAWAPVVVALLYAALFATLLHPTVVRPGGTGASERATPADRAVLFTLAAVLGLAAAGLPFGLFNFAIVGLAHAALNAGIFLARRRHGAGVPSEAEAARITADWMERRAAGQTAPSPVAVLLSTYGPGELDQTVRLIDGRVTPAGERRFDASLYERELADRINASAILNSLTTGRVHDLLRQAFALSAEGAAAHPASSADGRLTALVVDENMDGARARQVIDAFVAEQEAAPSGQTVLSVPPALAAHAAARAKNVPNISFLPALPAVDGAISLSDLETALKRTGALEAATSFRVAVAGNLRLDTAGLDAASPLRAALILLIDETLRSVAFTAPRMESLERVARLVGSQA